MEGLQKRGIMLLLAHPVRLPPDPALCPGHRFGATCSRSGNTILLILLMSKGPLCPCGALRHCKLTYLPT